ncbi:TPT domain-containing protein [Mycena chlorophos]|uniref:TPT domain-containing protein n=1 Tax=Mycena chlorophos TaxID=658473 RepID=A0A8H6TIF5_MYCCL|nr:TPT domain-containing protein [Mycena chlorophos]
MQNQPQVSSPLKVAAVVCFYIVAALVMVLVNKALLNEAPELPFTLLCIQFAIAVLLMRLLSFFSETFIFPYKFEIPLLDRAALTKLMPLLCTGFIGLVFNTLCLAKVDATFFQIARGLLLPFTIVVSSLFTHKLPTRTVVVASSVVTVGFFIGSVESFARTKPDSLLALLYGIISCAVFALHTVLSKVATQKMRNSILVISFWGNFIMAGMTFPLIFLNGEIEMFRRRLANPMQDWTPFVVGCGITGVFGCLLGLANILSIKVTSPTSHMFSAAAKSVVQTLCGVLFFGDWIDVHRAAGIALITAGTIFYTWTQAQNQAAAEARANEYQPIPMADDLEKQVVPLVDDEDGEQEVEVLFDDERDGDGQEQDSEEEGVSGEVSEHLPLVEKKPRDEV